ncbi:hypothetical protein CEUSTIGMA_g2561.t1 [Chlamydomonas eustigma]|uniref:Amine oxidase n=1 Tax=Chlamydomonas eustigma TaxID=1157962 RepID=A0A250WWA7_9CHLO|nr:hypothetical protein CEUSTIGMA_g2561.t1 [Chlamydomonas eustigma]|eukprot:GAX75117.1 hypothetical protein CEUSTIGMA_g2561.t1 [Chlamydomonas eustigma]
MVKGCLPINMEVVSTQPNRAVSPKVRTRSLRQSSTTAYPLDDLSAQEIQRASDACMHYATKMNAGQLRFNTVQLREPRKADLLRYQAGNGPLPPRQAQCVMIIPAKATAVDAVVDLSHQGQDRVLQWLKLDGTHPMTTPEDNDMAERIMKADPVLRNLVAQRYGITDMDKVVCDTWACHNAPAHLNSRRLMQGFLYGRLCPGDNEYAHPIDLCPIVDLNEGRVVHIDMPEGKPPPMPLQSVNYRSDLLTQPWRKDLKPLHYVQPEGPSFNVEGNLVHWQKWKIRLGFNAREGLVLHQVGYEDEGRVRPVLHRMSLAEMAVPYGDPNYVQARKSAFDVGDYGFGFCANSLALGCDCLGHIKYFDGVVNDSKGAPVVIKKAICMHEEDAGILWKHMDVRCNHAEVRRARKLVLQQISTFMNYEYILSYNFFQDGTISFEAKLSGILSTSVAPDGESSPTFGIRVAPGVNATVHQHFFCVRIDPAVDDPLGGRSLIVSETEAVALPEGPQNPFSNAFIMADTDLLTTGTAQRDVNFATARSWRIKNPNVINPISGHPVAFKIMPGPTPAMMMGPNSLVHRRARFATRNLWVTPYDDDQMFPAGNHVVQSQKCLGLAEWTKEEKSLVDADPVIWYSFGLTHSPRVEDFPVMPVEIVGFMLKPEGFFKGNPALDVPRERNSMSVEYKNKAETAVEDACCAVTKKAIKIVSRL